MNRVYLIGFMGSGKSMLGVEAAQNLTMGFIELDQMIAINEGMTIQQIFKDKGEDFFRVKERQALHQTVLLEHSIIACGGGTPCYFDNIEWMKRNGQVIWLNESEDILVDWLSTHRENRPLLKDLSDADLKIHIGQMLADRTPYYSKANVILNNPIALTLAERIRSLLIL